MQSRAERLLTEALALTIEERAKLIGELLASMDGESDGDDAAVEAAWAREIVRREELALAGQSRPVEWTAVRAEAVSRLRERG